MPQLLLVSAVDDDSVEGDSGSSVVLTALGAEGALQGAAVALEVRAKDNDVAALVLEPEQDDARVVLPGVPHVLRVRLGSRPRADVTISASSEEPLLQQQGLKGAWRAEPSQLRFTQYTWNEAQAVTVVADRAGAVGALRLASASLDADYAALSPRVVSFAAEAAVVLGSGFGGGIGLRVQLDVAALALREGETAVYAVSLAGRVPPGAVARVELSFDAHAASAG